MKPEPAYMMMLTKAHTQEEFIRGSMTKNPYSSLEIGPLMRDVKNKICHQLELLGLLEDDYGMELLVAGNIVALDLSVAQVMLSCALFFPYIYCLELLYICKHKLTSL
jgi:E3 ubiquitin-protein ligase UBR4